MSLQEDVLNYWVYGSDDRCQFVLIGTSISPRHCVLAEYKEGFALKDLGSEAGTWLNGQRLEANQPQWVKQSDKIVVGKSVRMPWPEHPSAPPQETTSKTDTRTIRIGRTAENDVTLDHNSVSGRHALLHVGADSRLILEDLKSSNGTFVGNAKTRIDRAEVQPNDTAWFGFFEVPVRRLLNPGTVQPPEPTHNTMMVAEKPVILGRDPNCGFPIDNPVVSFHHARLAKTTDGITVEDLGSRNGTFVDGERISGRVSLKPGSEIALGSVRLKLIDSTGKLERRDYAGNVTIEAVGVVVEIKRGGQSRRLLDPISLTVLPTELVALMGLAGAGKTTLMKALNGYTVPAQGRVLFNGEDLYANQDQFRLQVGYVPQDDILHPQLTVREALFYTAQLRTDLTPPEIHARIEKVLSDLGIEDIADRLIGSPERKVISGGQRKRVNIAMELLSDPSVLFLDEPTSGLSSFDALQVISLLRKLADNGKTIVCTIHQPSIEIFRLFDSLMMVARDKGDNAGVLAYYGPAYPDSIQFFNPVPAGKTEDTEAPTPEQLISGAAQKTCGRMDAGLFDFSLP